MADNALVDKQIDDITRFKKEKEFIDFEQGLKQTYLLQRDPWQSKWTQALAAVYMTDDLDSIYQGRAKIKSPVMKIKVRNMTSRITKVIFNIEPFARIEDPKIVKDFERDKVTLWNKYIFEHQLPAINFKGQFKKHTKNKVIQGTAISKVPQIFETKKFTFFDDDEPEDITIKDNPFLVPLLLSEFYSDVNKEDINESHACIHETVLSMDHIRKNKKRKEKVVFDLIDPGTGEVQGQTEEFEEVGIYYNTDLIDPTDSNVTERQEEYIQLLRFNNKTVKEFKQLTHATKTTGNVRVDEYYGKWEVDGEEQEIIAVIANNNVVIRMEPTPFKHKKYVRPFIRGVYEPIANCLYGDSNVMAGHNLLLEKNATREQVSDAKTRAIAPMWYVDVTRKVVWDKRWRPDGLVKGQGPNGMTPLLNPYLGGVAIQDSQTIDNDIDHLWSMSSIQEGLGSRKDVPLTRGATIAVMEQSDIPINDLIDDTYNNEIIPFLEMIYERNLVFKEPQDLLSVWTEKEIEAAFKEDVRNADSMKDFLVDSFSIKILGTVELANEVAIQTGLINFLTIAESNPEMKKWINYRVTMDKLLRSMGLKDQTEGMLFDKETMLEIQDKLAKAGQGQLQAQDENRKKLREEEIEDYNAEKVIDTRSEIAINQHKIEQTAEADIVTQQAEAVTETTFDVKVN